MPRAEYETILELTSRRIGNLVLRAVAFDNPGGRDHLALELIERDDSNETNRWIMKRRQLVEHGAVDGVGELRFEGDLLYFTTDPGTPSQSCFAVRATVEAFEQKPHRVEPAPPSRPDAG